ncbi:LysR substrate-binding domain-containing protein [Pseudodonghicola flavimaris]|uniref:LysR substrate-binding domain-containing protein n=1 Tax=Pseudodonghicola flavimaris TaxID=3050036 RepID=A0ABT7EV54_9RHOB|nr:LysR substrate-binding domain-containing protein [Pseudodonghicola flavimaris]MDK3016188.1 LysR substrate-binding domain-containing protein [Pseudodonghicola flavimaris]
MSRRLPPLSALPAFEATARRGSVTAAAEELGRTHSAVSKQIRHLSEDLGGDLFEKAGTGLRLTPRGERLRRSATAMLDELGAVAEALRAEQDDRFVDLAVSATLASRWLIPRLPEFYARQPDIELRLRMSGPQQLRDSDFDVLLSYDRLRGGLREADQRPLGQAAYGLVCAPGYPLEQAAPEQGPEGWSAPVRLTQPNALQTWGEWMQRSGVALRSGREEVHAHHFLALGAAVAGLGVALAERRLVTGDLAAGRLTAPFGFVTVPDGFRAAVMPRARDRRSVAALLDWLRTAAGQGD